MEGPRHQHLRKVLVKFSVFAGFEVGWRKLGEVVASMVFLFPEGKEGSSRRGEEPDWNLMGREWAWGWDKASAGAAAWRQLAPRGGVGLELDEEHVRVYRGGSIPYSHFVCLSVHVAF